MNILTRFSVMVLHDNSLYMYMFIPRVAICSVTETRDNCKLKIVGSILQSKVLYVSFRFIYFPLQLKLTSNMLQLCKMSEILSDIMTDNNSALKLSGKRIE